MLLADGRIAPAVRPIELGDQRLAILDADLIHPILIAVERQHPAVAAIAERLDCVQYGLRRELGIRCVADSWREFYRYACGHSFEAITLLECRPCDFPDLNH